VDSLDPLADEHRVRTEVFTSPTPLRLSYDVQTRSKDCILASCQGFLTKCDTVAVSERPIEACGDRQGGGNAVAPWCPRTPLGPSQ
jgi:hypothetical protein